MDANQRDSFRLEREFEAELFHEGRVATCAVTNLSAGGAHIRSNHEMEPGTTCELGIRLEPHMRAATDVDYLSFRMEVLEATHKLGGIYEYRLRNATGPGSSEYEAAARLVVAAQRKLAEASGADGASPMVTDEGRRRRLRFPSKGRFTKSSLRPGTKE